MSEGGSYIFPLSHPSQVLRSRLGEPHMGGVFPLSSQFCPQHSTEVFKVTMTFNRFSILALFGLIILPTYLFFSKHRPLLGVPSLGSQPPGSPPYPTLTAEALQVWPRFSSLSSLPGRLLPPSRLPAVCPQHSPFLWTLIFDIF